jgi:hypothetical protein
MASGATIAMENEGGGGGQTGNLWYKDLDADTQAYITAKGLADKDPAAAFAEAAKGHRNAEQYIGIKPERLLRLPEDANPEAWKTVYQRLGAADKPEGYDLSAVKSTAGAPLSPERIAEMQALFHANNVPVDMARGLAQALHERDAKADDTAAQAALQRQTEQMAQLRTSWGQNFDANTFVATQAMKAFGLGDEQILNLQKSAGNMELWRQIGARIGEDKFVQGGGGGGKTGAMTKEEAQAEKTALMKDSEWVKRWSASGREEVARLKYLDMMILGVNERGEPL